MKNKGTKQKSKKKGSENVFGCDLIEHLQGSGEDVPQVLKKCAEFIEQHGVVDGIYRLSGVTSNIQRLRQEFSCDACPDLTKEVYLQDIHCVGSLCKLYFRELPNPLLTYELYSKFTEAASVQSSQERLEHIQRVIKELPVPHLRTLEYLTKHLSHLATVSSQTNMHARNLALVWAPNLLRSKDIDASSCNGDMAFQEVRVQQSVVEFILNHTEQLFNHGAVNCKAKEGMNFACGEKYATLPISAQCGPMKLMSLEEAQARSLSANHPVHRERQRENSLPDTSAAMLFHTVIDISDSKRKFSGKSKKWKSIFNLGKSVTESKGKLSRNGSVFIRGQNLSEKAALRPARSMESLCSLQIDDDRAGNTTPSGGANGLSSPDVKSRTLGSDSLYDLNEEDQKWEFKGKESAGATGGCGPGANQREAAAAGSSASAPKTLPEQLKVFKGDALGGFQPTSPKSRRMLYSGSSLHGPSRPSFPGSLFPLESPPRHQRRAVIISEPFAVSVPLRVSAVISSNSTPCGAHVKEKPAAAFSLKPCKESGALEQGSNGSSSSSSLQVEADHRVKPAGRVAEQTSPERTTADSNGGVEQESQTGTALSEREGSNAPDARSSPGNRPTGTQLEEGSSPLGRELWSDLHQELKITEPELDLLDETFKPIFCSQRSREDIKKRPGAQSKRSCSSPTLSSLHGDRVTNAAVTHLVTSPGSIRVRKQASEADISLPFYQNMEPCLRAPLTDERENKQRQVSKIKTTSPERPTDIKNSIDLTQHGQATNPVQAERDAGDASLLAGSKGGVELKNCEKHEQSREILEETTSAKASCEGGKEPQPEVHRAATSKRSEERPRTLVLQSHEEEDACTVHPEDLDLVEPWDDVSFSKQWVTSPLHTPDIEDLFRQLPLSSSIEENTSQTLNMNKLPHASDGLPSGNVCQNRCDEPDTKGTHFQPLLRRINGTCNSSTQPLAGKCSTAKPRNNHQPPSQRFRRQMSQEACPSEKKEEKDFSKHRPCSLNLDLGRRRIRDISNQQSHSSELTSSQRGGLPSGAVNNGLSLDLELFLSDRQAPLRRNSAPVSVSSVRTAFMIKTCQAKAVPVIPPKVQYSQIPHFMQETELCGNGEQEKENPKRTPEGTPEEAENKKPVPKHQKQPAPEASRTSGAAPDHPVTLRRTGAAPGTDVFPERPRASRPGLLQRPSFRTRQRPQSLILLAPPFPIMDYSRPLDDSRLALSPVRSHPADHDDPSTVVENLRSPEGKTVQNKMTIPKSGQRLETSTSCFYQPQRRSMIFDSRSQRQIE